MPATLSDSPSAILVVGPSWVGDMVMAQTLFSELRRQYPDSAIDVLAPAWCRPLLSRMPEVREALSLPFDHGDLKLGERHALGKSLRGKYQQSYVLPNSLKSALVPWAAKIPRRIGWRGEMRYGLLNDVRKLDKDRYPLMVQRFVALAQPADASVPQLDTITAPHLEVSEDSLQQAMVAHGLTTQRPVLGLCPGAEFGPAKRWPEHHYAAVAQHWIDHGGQVWIFGSGKDQPVARAIVEMLENGAAEQAAVLAGNTSLEQAVDLLSATTAVVSNDSGLMHIAAALKRPLVAVYGSTSPGFTPPLGDRVAVVRLGLECSPCFERECPLGHLNCLRQLPPSQVIDALQQLESADA
jgi:heptosyltransferase-2